MKFDLIIQTIEEAKEKNLPFGTGSYFNNGAYCTIGLLCHKAGIDDLTLRLASSNENHPSDVERDARIEKVLEDNYEINDEQSIDIIHFNDARCQSWDQVIQMLKDYKEEMEAELQEVFDSWGYDDEFNW